MKAIGLFGLFVAIGAGYFMLMLKFGQNVTDFVLRVTGFDLQAKIRLLMANIPVIDHRVMFFAMAAAIGSIVTMGVIGLIRRI